MSSFAYCPNCPTDFFSTASPGNTDSSRKSYQAITSFLENILSIAPSIISKIFFGKEITSLKKLEAIVDDAEEQDVLVTERTIANALVFLLTLPKDVVLPELDFEENGDITMEWYRDKWNLFSVIVDEGDTYYYAGLFGSEKNREKGRKPLDGATDDTVVSCIKKIQG